MRYENSDGIKTRWSSSQQMSNNWEVCVRNLWMPANKKQRKCGEKCNLNTLVG